MKVRAVKQRKIRHKRQRIKLEKIQQKELVRNCANMRILKKTRLQRKKRERGGNRDDDVEDDVERKNEYINKHIYLYMSDKIIIIWKKGPNMKRSYKRDMTQKKDENALDLLELEQVEESISEISYNRELVGNRKINPFMKDNNYVNDLGVQDQFLRPQSCNKHMLLNTKKPLEHAFLAFSNKKLPESTNSV